MIRNPTAVFLTVTLLAALRLAPAASAPVPAGKTSLASAPEAPFTSAQIDALREKTARQHDSRTSAMTKAVELARKALETAKKAGQGQRVELLNRRYTILNERLDLLKQIAQFRLQRLDAERRGDEQAKREAQLRIDTAFKLINSHQAEERELRKKLDVWPK
ncbi:MAG: hypothetical protein HY303_18915 [Candidatus Wallbacteria bacterium]|nr:hypothetical protein [Candidatus Wallbacteria bacterium]